MMAGDDETTLGEQMRGRELGAYRLHWNLGGSSVAAVGMLSDGTRWFAPANWTAGFTSGDRSSLISTDWGQVERAELIQGHESTEQRPLDAADDRGDEMPRPFLRTAIDAATPEMMRHFEAEWAKAMAKWDGQHVILSLPVELHNEWGVRFPDNQIEVCETEEDARDWAWNDRGLTLMHRKVSSWQEVPDAT